MHGRVRVASGVLLLLLPPPGLRQPEQPSGCLCENTDRETGGRADAEDDGRRDGRETKGIGDYRIPTFLPLRNRSWECKRTPVLIFRWLADCQVQGHFTVLAS